MKSTSVRSLELINQYNIIFYIKSVLNNLVKILDNQLSLYLF